MDGSVNSVHWQCSLLSAARIVDSPNLESDKVSYAMVSSSSGAVFLWNESQKRIFCLVTVIPKENSSHQSRIMAVELIPSLEIQFSVRQLVVNKSSKLLAIVGDSTVHVIELPPPIKLSNASTGAAQACRSVCVGGEALFGSSTADFLKVCQLEWHPLSDVHLTVLTSDGVFRMFDMGMSPPNLEQEFHFQSSEEVEDVAMTLSRPVAFCFGGDHFWERFAIFFLLSNGSLTLLCPVLPFRSRVSCQWLRHLALLTAESSSSSLHHPPLSSSSAAAAALAWLHSVFPDLPLHTLPQIGPASSSSTAAVSAAAAAAGAAGKRKVEGGTGSDSSSDCHLSHVLLAHPYVHTDSPLLLQGPWPSSTTTTSSSSLLLPGSACLARCSVGPTDTALAVGQSTPPHTPGAAAAAAGAVGGAGVRVCVVGVAGEVQPAWDPTRSSPGGVAVRYSQGRQAVVARAGMAVSCTGRREQGGGGGGDVPYSAPASSVSEPLSLLQIVGEVHIQLDVDSSSSTTSSASASASASASPASSSSSSSLPLPLSLRAAPWLPGHLLCSHSQGIEDIHITLPWQLPNPNPNPNTPSTAPPPPPPPLLSVSSLLHLSSTSSSSSSLSAWSPLCSALSPPTLLAITHSGHVHVVHTGSSRHSGGFRGTQGGAAEQSQADNDEAAGPPPLSLLPPLPPPPPAPPALVGQSVSSSSSSSSSPLSGVSGVESRVALHAYCKALHKQYMEYAHRAHVELSGHAQRLQQQVQSCEADRKKVQRVVEAERKRTAEVRRAVNDRLAGLRQREERLRKLAERSSGGKGARLTAAEAEYKELIDTWKNRELPLLADAAQELSSRAHRLKLQESCEAEESGNRALVLSGAMMEWLHSVVGDTSQAIEKMVSGLRKAEEEVRALEQTKVD